MTVTIDITETVVFTVLRAFIQDLLGSTFPVVQGQDNRVPEPAEGDFIVFVGMTRNRLSTNVETWDVSNPSPTSVANQETIDAVVRIDVHGDDGADNAQKIETMFRSNYAIDFFGRSGYAIAPLYADEPQQMPFINASEQYENRWIVTLHLQADPIISTPQQFADIVTVTPVSVDAAYPPGA